MADYLCMAENKVGTVEKHFNLAVQGRTLKSIHTQYTFLHFIMLQPHERLSVSRYEKQRHTPKKVGPAICMKDDSKNGVKLQTGSIFQIFIWRNSLKHLCFIPHSSLEIIRKYYNVCGDTVTKCKQVSRV